MREGSSDADLVVLSWLLFEVEGVHVGDLTGKLIGGAGVPVVGDLEDSMLGRAEDGLSKLFVFFGERIVDDAETAAVFNRETDKNSDSRQVALYEIGGAIERVDPDDGVLSAEGGKAIGSDILLVVVLPELAFDPLLAACIAPLKQLRLDKRLDGISEGLRSNARLNVSDAFLRLLAHDSEVGIERVEADLNGFLDAQISDSHGVVDTLRRSLQVARFMHFANDLATLFAEVDADRQELRHTDFGASSLGLCLRGLLLLWLCSSGSSRAIRLT